MNLQMSLLAAVVIFCATPVSSENVSDEKCPYKDTVDLTGHEPLDNESYVYHNIVIPKDKWAKYDYRLGFRDQRLEAESHVRGCICGNPKYCVKLCCERGEFFNETSFECEKLPNDFNMPADLNIILRNKQVQSVNIFQYFFYQVGTPCDNPETLSMEYDQWELAEDGILSILNEGVSLNTVSYCLTPYADSDTDEYILLPMSCPIKNEMTMWLLLNTYGMAISVLFFIPTVLVYLMLKELRGNMRGKLLICYLISLTVSYSIMSFINISGIIFDDQDCITLGFTCYYFFIAAFLWLNVLCYDIWINFKEHSVVFTKRQNRVRFILYSMYVWGTAALMTLLTMWSQWSDLVPEKFKPGVGDDICWLDTNKWSAAIYFYWPNLLILIVNIATFVHLTLRIYRVRRNLSILTQKQKFVQENAAVILRLFIIMGISWTMDILSYCLRNHHVSDFIFILTDLCNATQGVLIFVLFVLKRNVYDSMRKSFSTSTTRKPRRSISSFTKVSTASTSNP